MLPRGTQGSSSPTFENVPDCEQVGDLVAPGLALACPQALSHIAGWPAQSINELLKVELPRDRGISESGITEFGDDRKEQSELASQFAICS